MISTYECLLVLSDFSKVTKLSVSHFTIYVLTHLFQLHCLVFDAE